MPDPVPRTTAAPAAPATPAAPASGSDASLNNLATQFFTDPSANPAPVAPTPAPAPAAQPSATPAAPAAATPAATPAADPAEPKPKPSIFDKTKPKAPDKPAVVAADPFAGVEPPANLSEQGVKDWKTFRELAAKKVSDAQAEVAARDAQLATFRNATPAEAAETARLKEQLTKAQERLAVLDIQETDDYKRQFTEPRTAAVAEVTTILGYNDKKVPDMALLLAKNPKDFNAAVAEMTNGLNSMDATTVQTAMRSAYQISQAEARARANSGELHKNMVAKSAAMQKQAFEESFKELGLGDGMIERIEIPDDASPEDRAEIEELNSTFANVRPLSEKYAFSASSPRDLARIAQKAALHDAYINVVIPRMDKEHRALAQRALAAEKELAAIKKAKNPGTFGGGSGAGSGAPQSEDLAQMATRMFTNSG